MDGKTRTCNYILSEKKKKGKKSVVNFVLLYTGS